MGAHPPSLPLLILLALLAGCAAPRASWLRDEPRDAGSAGAARTPRGGSRQGGPKAQQDKTHVVAAGENLYRISLRYGVDVDELASLNEIRDPGSLAVGTELRLPAARRAPRAGGSDGRAGSGAVASAGTTLGARPPSDRLPVLQWPVKGVLYSRYGQRGATRHDGIDIAAPEGSPIVAAADGEAIFVGTQRGYGNLVILRHDDGLVTIYAHNRENLIKEGTKVRQGDLIARVGRTGRATGPHCHFEVRRGTTPMEPLDFLPR